jgi:hypothetical protein
VIKKHVTITRFFSDHAPVSGFVYTEIFQTLIIICVVMMIKKIRHHQSTECRGKAVWTRVKRIADAMTRADGDSGKAS